MNIKISCCIVRDLLPNYIDKLTETDTNALIEEHLATCSDCKSIHEEMSSEMEINVKKTESKNDKIRDFLNKAKLGYLINKVFKITRILTAVLYLLMNIGLVYLIFSNIKHFSITEKTTVQNTILLFSITLLVPSLLILILFIRKDNYFFKIIKSIVQLILLIVMPFIFILGSILSLRMPSCTTNFVDYEKRDIYVNELLNNQKFAIFPDTLPDNIIDVDYFYKYEGIFDDNYLTLEISWKYKDENDYQNAKKIMQSNESINKQVLEDGFNLMYIIGNSNDDNQRFCFGYNDSIKRVTYRIYYEWI